MVSLQKQSLHKSARGKPSTKSTYLSDIPAYAKALHAETQRLIDMVVLSSDSWKPPSSTSEKTQPTSSKLPILAGREVGLDTALTEVDKDARVDDAAIGPMDETASLVYAVGAPSKLVFTELEYSVDTLVPEVGADKDVVSVIADEEEDDSNVEVADMPVVSVCLITGSLPTELAVEIWTTTEDAIWVPVEGNVLPVIVGAVCANDGSCDMMITLLSS